MTWGEFCEKIYEICEDAEICKDNDGQVVVYTNLTVKENYMVPFEYDEDK